MVAEKIIGNINDFDLKGRVLDRVWIEWYELEKKLLKKKTESGETVGIRVESHLHEGDILYADDSRAIAVDILPCELTEIKVDTMQEMGRLCFELGNRHLSLAIEEHRVIVPYDEPTFLYLKKLGFHPEKKEDKFRHFTVCHAHSHSHSGHGH